MRRGWLPRLAADAALEMDNLYLGKEPDRVHLSAMEEWLRTAPSGSFPHYDPPAITVLWRTLKAAGRADGMKLVTDVQEAAVQMADSLANPPSDPGELAGLRGFFVELSRQAQAWEQSVRGRF